MEQKWLLADMHMHSSYSKINKPSDSSKVKEMTAKEFTDIMLKNNVDIFSITDHNYFSDVFYDEIDEYIKKESLNVRLINGVEFDAQVELSDGSTDFIHMCIYFDDNTNRKMLSKIVNELYRDKSGNILTPSFTEILNKLYELKTKYIVIPHGNKERGLFKDNLIDNLNPELSNEYYKYAMYKIFNGFDVSPGFNEKAEKFWASSFFEKTKKFESFIDTKTEDEINAIKNKLTDKFKNKDVALSDEERELYDYIIQYGAYFSFFSFSDWHNKSEYLPKFNNFIFGSLDTAFSSFEMATLDPISRVYKSKDKSVSIPDTILEKVNFKINGKKKKIEFSPGLNAIVGKRGSGKSLLLAVIKNLEDKEAKDGAMQKYKSLSISDIEAWNRGGIKISLGSLSSVAFLSQDDIKNIFENPDNAQKTISSYFVDIKNIDKTKLNAILNIGEKVEPINDNYKNLTSNILSIKKFDDYNYSSIRNINSSGIKLSFNNIIKEMDQLIKNIREAGLNSNELEIELSNIKNSKNNYLKIIDLYNEITSKTNDEIEKINKTRSTNQIAQRQNLLDINNALNEISNNFKKQLYKEELKVLLNKISIENPNVELNKKGKYLFITYYEIPSNIKEIVENKVFSTITYANSVTDLDKYVMNDSSRRLKTTSANIMAELKKFVTSDDIFKAKKEFYEIKEASIDYKSSIKTMEDLKEHVNLGNIVNLTNASPGMKSVAYLDMLFDLEQTILIFDQPEDNIDNDYISNYLVPNIKNKKKIKQLIFVTHNPSVAVYGDAFNYVFVENNDEINYHNFFIEKKEDKEKLLKILEGGRKSFSNRNKKFGNVLGEEEYGNN